jgi:hypothetical protein
VTEPAFVTDHRQHDVSRDDPRNDCKSETEIGLGFEHSVGQDPRQCHKNVRQVVEEAYKRTKSDGICSYHASEKSDCQEVMKVHFPKIVSPGLNKHMLVEVFNEVSKLEQ